MFCLPRRLQSFSLQDDSGPGVTLASTAAAIGIVGRSGLAGFLKTPLSWEAKHVDADSTVCTVYRGQRNSIGAAEASSGDLKSGDIVQIIFDVEKLKVLQSGHGGYNDGMAKSTGRIGRVKRIDSDDDAVVEVCDTTWYFNPAALTKIASSGEYAPPIAEDCSGPVGVVTVTKKRVRTIGQIVDLDCTVVHKPDYFRVEWSKGSTNLSIDDQLMIEDPRYFISFDNSSSTYTLQISDIRAEDAGTYNCELRGHGVLITTGAVVLDIHKPLEFSDNTTRTAVVGQGSHVELDCYAEGKPEPQVTWHRVFRETFAPINDLLYSGNSLVIPEARQADSGVYYCVADNGMGPTKRVNVTLKVLADPSTSAKYQTQADIKAASGTEAAVLDPKHTSEQLKLISDEVDNLFNVLRSWSEESNERLKAIELGFLRPEGDHPVAAAVK